MATYRDRTTRIRRRSALAALATSTAVLAFPALAHAAPDAQTPGLVGRVYVNDNSTGGNTVSGFARLGNGDLVPLAGSPFPTGGSGTGVSIGSQGALQPAGNGQLLLAADAGSNEVSVLRMGSGGALTPVPGSPFPSGGIEPVSLAVHGDLVYVANGGVGGSNYTGFHLSADGALRPVPGSTFPIPDGSDPGDILFDATGRHLVATRVGTNLIDSFAVDAPGRLHPAPGSPFASQGPGPFGSAFRAVPSDQLFVSNAHGVANAGSISAYHVAPNATLVPVRAVPFPDLQTAPCWIALTPDQKYLFTSNTGSDSISRFAIKGNGALQLLGSTALRGGPGLGAFDLQVDPSGHFLYVVDTTLVAISILAVNGGNLTEIPRSPVPLPTGAAPFGLVVR